MSTVETVTLVLLLVVVGLAIAILILLLQQEQGPARTLPVPPDALSRGLPQDALHVSAYNTVDDALLYDGTYYVLRLKGVRLSAPTKHLKYGAVISDGYVSFDDGQQTRYNLGPSGIKIVYHDNATMFLVIPVSYAHEWLNKGLLGIANNQYTLDRNLFVVGSVELRETVETRAPLPLPDKNSISMVLK